ncbi:hypothetical protein [Dyella mobilis]|uniref:Uncharacterized protein n=1 Tax=Dyella mobilis TaxID=1849582 RepID=A0ABS2KK12_9GAMM|nr:hypothetical protein [Dyella mobilis]MBM7131497.1 hypothetical protein [Dyella mobilis]GLQ96531.1 hypothetical protein GCM10007863_09490 [Dyella mobilis]
MPNLPYSIIEQLRACLLGKYYIGFCVATSFGLNFDGFELSAQEVQSGDAELVSSPFVRSYAQAVRTFDPQLVGQCALLAACVGAIVSDVKVAEDASITLFFENGIALNFPTNTGVVDWHWAITEDGRDPYLGCIMGCFSPGEIRGHLPDSLPKAGDFSNVLR